MVTARLRQEPPRELPELVMRALELGGPQSQSRLTGIVEGVLGSPTVEAPPEPVESAPDHPTRMLVRRAVLEAWTALDADERDLLVSVARGDSYDELVARCPRFAHKVAVTRAISRVGQGFVHRVLQASAAELPAAPGARPLELRLFEGGPPTEGEEDTMAELLSLFARAAILRRAARDLAEEELLNGAFVEEEPSQELAPVRLAAHDAREQALYAAGPYRVRLARDEDGTAWLCQEQGPAGLTVELGQRRLPLAPEREVEAGVLDGLPAAIRAWDATGRRWRLVLE